MGVWVKKSGIYKSDKRHYYEDPTVVTTASGPSYWGESNRGVDKMASPALCGAIVSNEWNDRGNFSRYGGLSILEDTGTNLLSNSLCQRCKKKYVDSKLSAVDAQHIHAAVLKMMGL